MPATPPAAPATAVDPLTTSLEWDIFCRVIDNHGDLGVAWRLSAQLAAGGQRVRLWVDDPTALEWMAPGALDGIVVGVQVLRWQEPFTDSAAAGDQPMSRSDVWVEAFGCDIDPEFIAEQLHLTLGYAEIIARNPLWINLEYLSAEPYVERCHGLPSPLNHGPGQGLTRHFFYPGFTPHTGGLLRETGLMAQQAAFDRIGWLTQLGIDFKGERLVSLFCYEPAALGSWLAQLQSDPRPTRLLVTHGRAAQAVKTWIEHQNGHSPSSAGHETLSISYVPALTQIDYDHLLWACDLNFVRGEDSLVRALWAGRPFVWHIYPQHDGAHEAKLAAFLDWLQAPASLRRIHRLWNGLDDATAGVPWPPQDLQSWTDCVVAARTRLSAQPDLVTELLGFVTKRR